ncbi:MAG: alpha/beta hydrolase [Gammaproteobacteria bacterium]|nr:alpha/beta hydrolase [Gammaproteobacteria bacterium]
MKALAIKSSLWTSLVFVAMSGAVSASTQTEEDVIYGYKDGMALIYHVLVPETKNNAAVLFIISGGWFSYKVDMDFLDSWTSYLTDEGFTVFAVNHGSSPRYQVPDAVTDVRRAVRHVRTNAENFEIDPDRIGVMGLSAGGHLSLMLGLTGDDGSESAEDPLERVSNRVQAVVAYYPVVDLKELVSDESDYPALRFDSSLSAENSPIEFVSRDDPPVLLLHGDQDEVVPIDHSRRMYAALTEIESVVEFEVIEGAGHSFHEEDDRNRVEKLTVDFFSKHLVNESED